MAYPPPAALKKFLKPYDPDIRDLALQLRALVLEEMAPCYENIYDAYSAVAIGYGASDRLTGWRLSYRRLFKGGQPGL